MSMDIAKEKGNLLQKENLLPLLQVAYHKGEQSPFLTERELIEIIKDKIISPLKED